MSRKTLLVLLLVVAGLGFAVWRESRREAGAKQAEEIALFEGVDPSRVLRLRIENLERDQHIAFEPDGRGRWQMVEPLRIEADQELVQHLLRILVDRRATPELETGSTPADLHLAPPRAILEVEVEPRGQANRMRVDLGAIDIDGAHVHVRSNGRLLRTWRDIDTMLDRPLDEWMSHAILALPPDEVVEIHRRGRIASGAADAALPEPDFDALLEDGTWRATTPVTGLLSPETMHLYVQGIAGLRAASFADFGRALLADLGLDPPEITVTLSTVSARTAVVRFGRSRRAAGEPWHCSVDGKPYVWIVEAPLVEFFDASVEILLDPSLSRLPVDEVEALTLAFEGRELRLWREKTEARPWVLWKVSERAGPETAYSPGLLADKSRVEDLLARVSHAQIVRFLPGTSLSPGESRGTIALQAGEERAGGQIGGDVQGEGRVRAVRYQRSGDSLAGLLDAEVLGLLRTPMAELLSLLVVDLQEIEQAGLEISGGGVAKRFVRSTKGLWTPPDLAVEARELRDVLDSLLILRATEHRGDGALPALDDPIRVEFTSVRGTKTAYTVGLARDAAEPGRVEVERDGRRSVLKDQGLHRRLLAAIGKH